MKILTGENIPEPFNQNDVLAWTGRILRDMCREGRECFYPSEFILDEELQEAMAYDNAEQKERAISDGNNVYHTFARFCLEELSVRTILWRKTVRDPVDDIEYNSSLTHLTQLCTVPAAISALSCLFFSSKAKAIIFFSAPDGSFFANETNSPGGVSM
jgi:hypothetical protein